MAATTDRQTLAHMINAFRVVSVISIPFMGGFPSVWLPFSTPFDRLTRLLLGP